MSLDFFTVHVCNALLNLTFFLILAVIWSRVRQRYLLFWSVSLLMVGTVGMGFTVIHDRAGVGILQGLVAGNVTLIWAGLRCLDGRSVFHRLAVAIPSLVTMASWSGTFWSRPDYAGIFIDLLFAANVVFVGRYCLTGGRKRAQIGRRIIAWSLLAYAPLYLFSALAIGLSYGTAAATTIILVGDLVLNSVFVAGIVVHAEEEARGELKRLAMRDQLTGALNRAGLFAHLEAASGQETALLLLDLDHFKRVNDTWGHGAGDAVLCGFVRAVEGELCHGDIVGRLGGEEFLVVLSNTGQAQAAIRAEAIRQAVSATAIAWNGTDLHVTASIGMTVRGASEPFELAIRRADEALYRAKDGGRDKIAA